MPLKIEIQVSINGEHMFTNAFFSDEMKDTPFYAKVLILRGMLNDLARMEVHETKALEEFKRKGN